MTTFLAVFLRPFVYFILFVVIVAPIIWVLNKIIPDGRIKFFLFKVRSGELATRRDKLLMIAAVILSYILLVGSIIYYFDI